MQNLRIRQQTTANMQKNLEKLSSGRRINRAGDDAAGLAISEKMRAKITELSRAHRNASEGLNLARTADAALAEINDMLGRARALCIQAANGTYSEQEQSAVSDEINRLFSEIDRITAGSRFNTICLFRGKVEEETEATEEPPLDVPPPQYTYSETVETLPSDELEEWGEIHFIRSEDFDAAVKSRPATVSFQLDDSIQTAADLSGRGFTVDGRTYLFVQEMPMSRPSTYTYIDLKPYKTLDSAMEYLARQISSRSMFVSNIQTAAYDGASRTLTFTGRQPAISENIIVDGKQETHQAAKGKGAYLNGQNAAKNLEVLHPLREVDGGGHANNQPVTPATASVTFSMPPANEPMTAEHYDTFAKGGHTLTIAGTVVNMDVGYTSGMTWGNYLNKLAARITSASSKLSAKYSGESFTIELTESSTGTPTAQVTEQVPDNSTSTTTTKDYFKASPLTGVSAVRTQPADVERQEKWEVTLPDSVTAPVTLKINNRQFVFYDGTATPLKREPGIIYIPTSSDLTDISRQGFAGALAQAIQTTLYGTCTVSVSGNKLIVASKNNNQTLDLRISPGTAVTVQEQKTVTTPSTKSALFVYGDFVPFRRSATVSFSLGKDFDKDKWIGSGFGLSTFSKYEFVNGAGTGLRDDYHDIDISTCTSFDDLLAKVIADTGLDPNNPRIIYRPGLDKSDLNDVKLVFSADREAYFGPITDGVSGQGGLVADDSLTYSGGTDTGYSQKILDFSSINETNLDTLLGKGFRIHCATCAGEYINVFFCMENKGNFPESFQRYDEGTQEMRTIHNIAVELSKVTDGSKIAESIVEQVKDALGHYTAIELGENPAAIVARDRRIGDVLDPSGALRLGRVQTGVLTNFRYTSEKHAVEENPGGKPGESPSDQKKEPSLLTLASSKVKIYVGDNGKPQYIHIHLPYLDLETLNLYDGEKVNLAASDPLAWLKRVDRANDTISSVRGIIGADYNRLEHALQALSNEKIQLTESESVIRDTDIAEAMMEQVKLQILTTAQQSMLAQANAQPNGVLELLVG